MKNKIEKGFTLIELLVVIAIIGILAGILFVTINPKKQADKADDAKTLSAIEGIRVSAANYFTTNMTYDGVQDSSTATYKILTNYPMLTMTNSDSKWAVKGTLNNGKVACRDSSGGVSEKANQDITDFKCD